MSFLTYDGYETTQILVKLHFQCEFSEENIDTCIDLMKCCRTSSWMSLESVIVLNYNDQKVFVLLKFQTRELP